MRYFFAKNAPEPGEKFFIKGGDANHIANVLRKKPGDIIGLLDGTGFERQAVIENISGKSVELKIIKKTLSGSESCVNITVAQGFLKDKKMDALIKELTGLGIAAWAPFIAKRSVPKISREKKAGRLLRWEKIAKEAIKQSRNSLSKINGIGKALSKAITNSSLHHKVDDLITSSNDLGISIIDHRQESYPQRLKNATDAPLVIFKKGNVFYIFCITTPGSVYFST